MKQITGHPKISSQKVDTLYFFIESPQGCETLVSDTEERITGFISVPH